ncbi:MAG: trypsin-like peptidase domain-containing protein [Acutalibacteraceae bacterium]|nr:trypsin-like peptidase domain-containing protein [Acutalibacteraceae bacterium]
MNDEFNKNTDSPEITPVEPETVPVNETKAEEPVSDTAAESPVVTPETTAEIPQNEPAEKTEEEVPTVKAEQVQPPENPIYTTQPYTNAPRQAYPNRPQQPQTPYNYPPQYRPVNGVPYAAPQPQRIPTPQPAEKPKKKRTGLKVFAIILAIILAFSFGVGVMAIFSSIGNNNNGSGNNITEPGKSDNNFATDNEGAPDLNISDSPVSPSSPLPDGTLTTSQIATKVKPSIVGIVVYTQYSNQSAGEGTGVIMGEDNSKQYTYIITCAHVINDPGISVRVQTENGTSYDAQIVGVDTRTDLGVLKIKATGLPAAEFGNSDALQVGDSVYAIGNPGGVEFFGSFTGGFVSAIDRPVSSEIGYTMKCIQHDAAINPGNSGGALVNAYGQVIGINSQKIAATDYEGMGFAIPITSAKSVVESLINYNYVPNRSKLGITYYPVSASERYSMIAQIKGLPAGTLIIDKISEDSSLANTQVRQNDMITAVNGKPLTNADVLLEKIDSGKVGDRMTLTICRVNSDYSINEFDVEVTLVEDKDSSSQSSQAPQSSIDPFDYFGN